MSNIILFDFQGDLPAPFDTLDSPRLTEPQHLSVYNGYGEKQVSTLSPALISAIHVYLDLINAAANGGVGESAQCTFAEYRSTAEEIRLARYNANSGVLSYGIYKHGVLYPCSDTEFDPLVLWLALFPSLLDDQEFHRQFDMYKKLYANNEKLDSLLSPMSVLCDNAYRRITQTKCPNHLSVNLFPSLGRFFNVTANNIVKVQAGYLRVFGAGKAESAKSKEWTLSELQTNYAMNPSRTLTPKEQSLIPTIPAYFDIPDQAVFICRHIAGTTNSQTPIRNIMLRGKSGTGKTGSARLIAAILGRPYLLFTCSSDTEAMDLIGQPVPAGMLAVKQTSKQLPSYDRMVYDPAGAYLALTGQENEQATTQQCIAAYMPGSARCCKPAIYRFCLFLQRSYHSFEKRICRGDTRGCLHSKTRRPRLPQFAVGTKRLDSFAHRRTHRTPSGSRGCHDHERRLRRAGSHQSKRVGPYGLDRGFAGPASKEADPAPESRYRVPGRSRLGQNGRSRRENRGVLPGPCAHRRSVRVPFPSVLGCQRQTDRRRVPFRIAYHCQQSHKRNRRTGQDHRRNPHPVFL